MKISDFDAVRYNEKMSAHTTFRVGGAADMYIEPKSAQELAAVIKAARAESIGVTVIGNGSNLLVRDGGIRGLVVKLGRGFSKTEVKDNTIAAEGGALMSAVAAAALAAELGGFEFASGIPGTVGGGLYMNAGAYGGSLSDVVYAAEYFDGEKTVYILNKDMKLGYRHSVFEENGGIVTKVWLKLERASAENIRAKMTDFKRRRAEKQPIELASAGSTFKRPEGYFAGALIEQAGLKGAKIGGAEVSEKHAGFIVNRGGATAAEVLELIEYVQDRVFAASGVMLEPEVRIIGEA